MDWYDYVRAQAPRYGVDPDLAAKVVRQESGGNPDAVSKAGAIGLMQLMPKTAEGLGVDPRDPRQNVHGGLTYLSQQLKQFGRPDLALAAYNAGPGAVQKHGGIPPYDETQQYVRAILGGNPVYPQQQQPDPYASPMDDGFERRMQMLMEMQQQPQSSLHPLMHIGLGILSTPTGTGSPLMGIARGVQKGLAAYGAGNPQAMTPIQMLQAEATLAKLEAEREDRALARKQRTREEAWRRNEVTRLRNLGTPEALMQADMLEAQVTGSKDYLDFLQDQKPEIKESDGKWYRIQNGTVTPVEGMPQETEEFDTEYWKAVQPWSDDVKSDLIPKKEAAMAAEQLRVFLQNPGAYGDVAAITSLVKLLDPTSVVREAETDMITGAQSLFGRIDAAFRNAAKGGTLNEEIRNNIIQNLNALMALYQRQTDQTVSTWRKRASDMKIKRESDIGIQDIQFPSFGDLYSGQVAADGWGQPKEKR